MGKKLLFVFLWVLLGAYCLIMVFFVDAEKEKLLLGDYNIEIIDSLDNKFIDKKEIINLINTNFGTLKGKKLDDINRDSVESVIETHACIENAEVYNNASGVVKIKLKQRKPIFRVLGSETFYVDKDKKIMPFSTKYTSRVCVVTGKVDRKLATGVLFDFCEYINCDNFWGSFIEQIHVKNKNDVTLIPKIGEFDILIGSFDNFKEKMSNLKAFLDNGNKNKIWGRYKKINLKYKDQVVCIK